MSEKYPLYPEFSEEVNTEAIKLVDKLKKQLDTKSKEINKTIYLQIQTLCLDGNSRFNLIKNQPTLQKHYWDDTLAPFY